MEQNKSLTPLSQQLRKNMTKEENLLWYHFLRKYPCQFRRQYKIGSYIVDFFCFQAKLVVELDGSQHCTAENLQKDASRTAYLKSQGLSVLRFSNLDVLKRFRSVCEVIDTAVKERTENHIRMRVR